MKINGEPRVFNTGAKRDSVEGKPAMHLLPYDLFYKRLAPLYGAGAKRYGDNNWRLGQPQSECLASLERHLTQYMMGERDEDHLAGVIFNALSIMNVDEYHSGNTYLYDIQYNDKIYPNRFDRELNEEEDDTSWVDSDYLDDDGDLGYLK
jgi:hypothetical protein